MSTATASSYPSRSKLEIWLAIAIAVLLAVVAFRGAIAELFTRWMRQEEYSHGFFIPLISAWLLWKRREFLRDSVGRPSWAGFALIAVAGALNVIGELSAIFLLAQVGFVLSLLGIVLAVGGFSLLRVTFIPIVYLLFAIPLPYFIDSVLSLRLQLLSSELAGVFIRLLQIPVYIDGNIIDLGSYKLQVVDACSGLRYLFPFMSLGFLAAYLFQAPLWQRAVIFLSTVPITILMNSLRIAMVGVLVNYFGKGMADDALHLFEGWIIFIACALLLTGEIWLLARLGQGKSFFQVFYLPKFNTSRPASHPTLAARRLPLAVAVVMLTAGGLAAFHVSNRQEIIPDRTRFVAFPIAIGEWRGRISNLVPQVEHALGLDDHILADYARPDGRGVNFYVAYYSSQRKGVSPHSPLVCIPGGGWKITQFDRTSYSAAGRSGFPFNRAVIERGSDKQIVYYWFEQRGRKVANEWLSKWYLLIDAIAINRTDAALVRLTTTVFPNETEGDADERLLSMIPEFLPTLSAYLPGPGTSKTSAQIVGHYQL